MPFFCVFLLMLPFSIRAFNKTVSDYNVRYIPEGNINWNMRYRYRRLNCTLYKNPEDDLSYSNDDCHGYVIVNLTEIGNFDDISGEITRFNRRYLFNTTGAPTKGQKIFQMTRKRTR